jgi:hypothetical protein
MTTNDTLDMHRPTDAFRDYLEDEVVREFRRRRTFRRLRAAAVIIVSAGIGMTATFASAQVRESSAKDSLIQAAQADAMLASMRLNLARMQLAEEQKQIAVGMRAAGVLPSETMVREMEAEVARIALDIAEIEATARSPRDELNAPVVNGRDFVRDRLQLRMMVAQQRLSAAERSLEDADRRVRVGAATQLESADYGSSVLQRRGELAVLAEQLNARREYLEKNTPVRELTLRVERTEVQQAIQLAQRQFANAQARATLLERSQQVGADTKLALLEAQANVELKRMELVKLVRRLQQLARSGQPEGH